MKTLSIILQFTYTALFSQNLVLNGGFEVYEEAQKPGKIPFATNWSPNFITSPDYFNADSTVKMTNPFQRYCCIKAKEGYGYMGIGLLKADDGQTEHIIGEFAQPLQKGKVYEVSFYVRHRGESCPFYVTRLGVKLAKSKEPFFKDYGIHYQEIIDSTITYDISNNEPLKNDTTWQLIKGLYIAKGGEERIAIGVFYEPRVFPEVFEEWIKVWGLTKVQKKKDDLLKALEEKQYGYLIPNQSYDKHKNLTKERGAYYFIDNVIVEEVK